MKTPCFLCPTVFKVDLQKSTPSQIRQRILHLYSYNEQVDEILQQLTFQHDFKNTLCEINLQARAEGGDRDAVPPPSVLESQLPNEASPYR